MKKVVKAVIPAAGLGTRFLPATKTVPKEMFPIVDRPIILYIVEEAVRAGIEDIIIIAGRHKTAIEDFFDVSYELEALLEKQGKVDWLDSISKIRDMVNIVSIRQKKALGLGHAVLCAEPAVGKQPFAVLLGDEIMISNPNQPTVTEQLVNVWNQKQISVVGVMPVAEDQVKKYGIVEGEGLADKPWRATRLVEKPAPEETKSRWAIPGRYVFDSAIFAHLKNTKPGKLGEIQLTDAMNSLAQKEGLFASAFQAQRFDAGDKFGYIKANIELSLQHPEIGAQVRDYVSQFANKFGASTDKGGY